MDMAIKHNVIYRKNPLSQNEDLYDLDFKDKTLYQVFCEVMEENKIPFEAYSFYSVNINGVEYTSEEMPYIKLNEKSDVVRISVVPNGGKFRETFKQLVLVVIMIVVAVFAPQLGPWAAAAIATGSTIAASWALNKLLPPIVYTDNGVISGSNDIASSQTYSLSGQSNNIKPFGIVPKLYGRHRIFPNIAGNPYITIEVDESTGALSQYMTSIYDLGHGPIYIEDPLNDIYIGDTPIKEFTDYKFNLVDLNKPDELSTNWPDYGVNNSFTIYKGDVNTESGDYTFTSTLVEGGAESTFRVTRNFPANIELLDQELSILLVFPKGLYSYSSDGNLGNARALASIEIAKANDGIFKEITDESIVKDFTIVAGKRSSYTISNCYGDSIKTLYDRTVMSNSVAYMYDFASASLPELITSQTPVRQLLKTTYVSRYINTPNTSITPSVGEEIYYGGIRLGKIQSYEVVTPVVKYQTPYYRITLDKNLNREFTYDNTLTREAGKYTTAVIIYPFPQYSPYTYARFYRSTSSIEFNESKREAIYGQVNITPANPGEYIFRLTYYSASYQYSYQKESSLSLVSFSQRLDVSPVTTTFRHVFLELKIKATNQLNGTIQNLSAIGTSVLEYYDTNESKWLYKPTSNPAWIYVDLLTNSVNKRKVGKEKLHMPSILEWANFCDEIPNDYLAWEETVIITNIEEFSTYYAVSFTPSLIFDDLEGVYKLSDGTLVSAMSSSKISVPKTYTLGAIGTTLDIKEVVIYTKSRYEANFILDYAATLIEVINSVTNSYQASYSIIDGKYGVLIDKRRTSPVQIFTPRNSWNFTATRQYIEQPHALKVKYIDPSGNWETREQLVYRDGFNSINAEAFETINSFAVTNAEQAFRFGRYVLAQNLLRKETYTIDVDFEHLVCTRGDFVQISNDVILAGGVPSRIRSVVDNTTYYTVTLDENIIYDPLKTYGVVVRNVSGIQNKNITAVSENSFNVAKPFTILEGSLCVVGESDKVVYDCIVKTITPNDNMSAKIVLVERADAIHDSESSYKIPKYDPKLSFVQSDTIIPLPVENTQVVDSRWECSGSGYKYFIDLTWDIPSGSFYSSYEIYLDVGYGYALADICNTSYFTYEITNLNNLGIPHNFKVLGLNSIGSKSNLSSAIVATTTLAPKSTRPSDVSELGINVTGEVLQLSWTKIVDCDCDEYLIRYSPLSNGLWEVSIPLLRVDSNTSMASFQARTGTYLIKAVDFNGNESLTAAKAITSIPELFNLHFIDEITDSPTWLGKKDATVVKLNSIMLKEKVSGLPGDVQYYSEGYYYYRNLIDLGEIYTLRIESSILAEGYTPNDMMINWITLDSVSAMSGSRYSDWDVELQVRSTDRFDVMNNWSSLANLVSMAEGGVERWTPWRKLSSISDYTGRIFQFRLKLISNNSNITPRVYLGNIKAHMPTRTDSFSNVVCPINGLRVNYTKDFYGPSPSPIVQISQDSAITGDVYAITDKDLTGFHIEFFDANGASVSRQFDATIKGFGYKYTDVI